MLVRTDISNLLSQTLTWTLNIGPPQLQLSGPRWLGGGKFAVRVTGIAPQDFSIQASTNLQANSWQDLVSITNPVSPFVWSDESPTFLSRFYRVVAP